MMAPGTVLLLLAGVVAALLPDAAESRILLTLDDFGAVGDGVADDTKAFAEAWKAACTAADNVILNVPAGKTFQIWPVTFSGPCRNEIKLFISGNIVAPESPDDWGSKERSQWLHFSKVEDLTVTGGGIIDGRGQQWWAQSSCQEKLGVEHHHHHDHDHDHDHEKKDCATQPAPKAVHFEDCKGISLRGITLQNSPQYHLTFTRSSDIEANYLRVTSPADSPNTNGVHLVDSYNVHVMDDLISTGDDCVSIVGNCTDVRLRAISCGPGHGISIGTLGENNSTDYVEKIKIDTLFISDAENGVRVRTTKSGGGGFARKVKFGSIVMRNVKNPIIIDQGRSDHHLSDSSSSDKNATEEGPRAVLVEKINYIDIRGTSSSKHAVTFSCSDVAPCRHLTLKNVNLTRVGGHKVKSYCRKAFGRSIGTVIPESCLSKEDFVQQVPAGRSEEDGDEDLSSSFETADL